MVSLWALLVAFMLEKCTLICVRGCIGLSYVPSKPRPASFDPADLPPGPLISSDFNLLILAFKVPN